MPAKAKISYPDSKPQGVRHSRLFELWRARKGALAGLFLFFLALATFWPAVENDFVGYDDPDYVTGNLHIQQGLSWETIRWAFSNTEVSAWHPLVWLSHALDYQCFGLQPWGHHLTAIVLHALNSALCFLILWRLTGAFGRSWALAALFALHPLRVESVAWVSERKDVLSMAFFLLTLWAYCRYVESLEELPAMPAHRRKDAAPQTNAMTHTPHSFGAIFHAPESRFFLGLSLFWFALGLMSKPMLVTVPFVLLLLDAWPLQRWPNRSAWNLVKEKIPFFGAALAGSLITVLAQPHGAAITRGTSLIGRLENAAVSYCRYLGELFWPAGLAPFYPPVEHWPVMVWLGAVAVLLAITLLAVRIWRSRPYLLVGWLWFMGTLVPVIGLVQIGEQSIADRYSYIPSVGILLSLVWGISELTTSWRFRAIAGGTMVAAALALCLVLTRAQLAVWKNSETLFTHTLSVTHGNYLAHNNLGVVLDQEGHGEEAIDQYNLALKIKPGYPEALKNLGVAFEHKGQLEKAEEFFQDALKQRPDFASAHNGLGSVYEKVGRFEAAEEQFREALISKP